MGKSRAKLAVSRGDTEGLVFETDTQKIRDRLRESSKTIEQRVKEIEGAKYVTQDMLRREVSI